METKKRCVVPLSCEDGPVLNNRIVVRHLCRLEARASDMGWLPGPLWTGHQVTCVICPSSHSGPSTSPSLLCTHSNNFQALCWELKRPKSLTSGAHSGQQETNLGRGGTRSPTATEIMLEGIKTRGNQTALLHETEEGILTEEGSPKVPRVLRTRLEPQIKQRKGAESKVLG